MLIENFLAYGKSKPIRLLYYPINEAGPWEFTAEEQEAILKLKQYCQAKGRDVP